jgi:alkanesulfonate monooxygenase SsuD/methylene tetrahydromethanopterin reductase-like flavin-dependent oxidoreductase (luciferase family)
VALNITAEGLIEGGTALIGSPRTVLAGIERMRERTGFGILVALLQFGILSDELTRRNMDLFAAEVIAASEGLRRIASPVCASVRARRLSSRQRD